MQGKFREMMKKPWQFMGAQDIGAEDDPYLSRLRIFACPFFSIYLHHIFRDDDSRAPHDHPWPFASWVLTGGYTERLHPDKHDAKRHKIRTFKRWSWHYVGLKAAHAIQRVESPLWTLVFTGPAVNPRWGFFPAGKYVFWGDYADREPIRAGWPKWKEWEPGNACGSFGCNGDELNALATYNTERMRGILHSDDYVAQMGKLQERYDQYTSDYVRLWNERVKGVVKS